MSTTRPMRLTTRAKVLLRGLRYAPILPFASIDGFLSVDEAIALYEVARDLPHEHPCVVEIGSCQGKSAAVIGRGLRHKRNARLLCIDPLDASGDEVSQPQYERRAGGQVSQLRRRLEENLVFAGVREIVDIRQGRSHELAASVTGPIDMLFIDGDHGYDAVLQDYRDWAPKLRPGGFLCMHDVRHPEHDGPRRVVDEVVAPDPIWLDQRYVVSMFVARKSMPA